MRQYLDLSTDEIKYLTKLKVALMKVNWKLYHNITKYRHRVTSKGIGRPPLPIVGDPILDETV